MLRYLQKLLLSSLLLFGCESLLAQSIEITEFMASNEVFLADEDGDYPDWIELYNASGTSINLEGWFLSDNEDNLTKWTFPSFELGPGKYLLVFASGKDRDKGELHSNFKLASSGEIILVTEPNGQTVSFSTGRFPPQRTDISYGLINGEWVYMDAATPGFPNVPGSLSSPPVFSVERGFFEEAFDLSLSSWNAEAEILYTLDGSMPQKGKANTFVYEGPIRMEKTQVVQAISIYPGLSPSSSITHTYIFPSEVLLQSENPQGYPDTWGLFSTIEGEAPADYGMDPEIVQDPVYKDQLIPALLSLPSISLVTDKGYLFSHSTDADTGGIYIHTDPPTGGLGKDWERPVSFEILYPDENRAIQVNAGVRIQGGHSRVPEKNPKHSFRVVFRSEYGPKKLNHDVFGKGAAEQFNSIILRAGFNQTWLHWAGEQRNMAQYINDSWVKDTWKEMGHLAAHNKFVHLYINGLYWGMYNLSERMDKEFMAHYLKGKESEYDVIKDYAELAEGEKTSWNDMMRLARNPENFLLIQGKDEEGMDDPSLPNYLDIESLIDFMILNFYIGNRDWDHHNWVAVRNRVEPDKGFQFLPWDSERSFVDVDDNMVNENNDNRPSYLYAQLRQNPRFWKQFMERAEELLGEGGILGPGKVAEGWRKRSQEIELAVIAESARWGDYRRDVHPYRNGSYELYTQDEHWAAEQARLYTGYFPRRSERVYQQLLALNFSTQTLRFDTPFGSYPNPVSDQNTIFYETDQEGIVIIELFNSQGQRVRILSVDQKEAGLHLFEWNRSGLTPGIYVYRIRTESGVHVGRVVVE